MAASNAHAATALAPEALVGLAPAVRKVDTRLHHRLLSPRRVALLQGCRLNPSPTLIRTFHLEVHMITKNVIEGRWAI